MRCFKKNVFLFVKSHCSRRQSAPVTLNQKCLAVLFGEQTRQDRDWVPCTANNTKLGLVWENTSEQISGLWVLSPHRTRTLERSLDGKREVDFDSSCPVWLGRHCWDTGTLFCLGFFQFLWKRCKKRKEREADRGVLGQGGALKRHHEWKKD